MSGHDFADSNSGRTVEHDPSETVDEIVRKHYTVRWVDGHESASRLEQARRAVIEANPRFDKKLAELHLPRIRGLPFLRTLIDAADELHDAVHKALEEVEADARLLSLSFIDPIRLGCEELGIAVTPAVAEEVRSRLAGELSFDQEAYEEIRDGRRRLHGISNINWVR